MAEQPTTLSPAHNNLPLSAELRYVPVGPWGSVMAHKRLAFSCLLSVLAITVCVILFYPRKYHSVAKLLVRDGRENVTLDPTASTTGDTQAVHRTRESEVVTAIEIMTSREILQGIVDEFGVETVLKGALPGGGEKERGFIEKGFLALKSTIGAAKGMVKNIDPISDEEDALITLESNLEISAPSEAGVVTVDYRTKTPKLAKEVVAKWVTLFQDHYLKSTRTRGAFDFFVKQDKRLKEELDNAREELSKAKTRYGLITIAGQQKSLEQQIQTIELEILSVEAKLAETDTRVESLSGMTESIEPTRVVQDVSGRPNQARDSMRSRLYDLEVEEKRLRASYTDSHPWVIAVSAQLKAAADSVDAEEENRNEVTTGINPIRLVVDEKIALEKSELNALSTKIIELENQKQKLMEELSALNSHEQVVATLDRRIEVLDERYRAHSLRFEQARLDQALEEQRISSISVVQEPTLEYRPVSPRKKICAALGLFAALAASVGLPMWIETYRFSKLRYANPAALVPNAPKQVVMTSAAQE